MQDAAPRFEQPHVGLGGPGVVTKDFVFYVVLDSCNLLYLRVQLFRTEIKQQPYIQLHGRLTRHDVDLFAASDDCRINRVSE